MKKIGLVYSLILFFAISFQTSAQWVIINPQPQNNSLFRVQLVSNTIGWAVGDQGTIIKTSDGGASWIQQNSGTTKALYGVSFVNENFGTAVGDAGTILNTTDGGTHWNLQSSGTINEFENVYFSDVNIGTTVG